MGPVILYSADVRAREPQVFVRAERADTEIE